MKKVKISHINSHLIKFFLFSQINIMQREETPDGKESKSNFFFKMQKFIFLNNLSVIFYRKKKIEILFKIIKIINSSLFKSFLIDKKIFLFTI